MALAESRIRKIVNEETRRALRESADMNPADTLRRGMLEIEDILHGILDEDDAKIEASGTIESVCDELSISLHNWVLGRMSEMRADRDEYERDERDMLDGM